MRAIVIEKKGGPDVLEYRDRRAGATPGEDELLVAVEAIGVNYRDVYEREGRGAAYGNAKVPLIVGAEGAGTVLEGAARGRARRVGRRARLLRRALRGPGEERGHRARRRLAPSRPPP